MQNIKNLKNLQRFQRGSFSSQVVISFLTSLVNANGGVYYPMQETANSVSLAVNPALATGRDIVINGDFATDTIWSKGTGWTISGNNATSDGSQVAASDLSQTIVGLEIGKSYEVVFTVTVRAGTMRIFAGEGAGTLRSTSDTYTETLIATSTNQSLRVQAGSTFEGDVDNITVKQTSIAASTAFPGSEELTDGNMEAAGVGDWTASGATLSKQTGTRTGGSGSQVLRIVDDSGNPFASQTISSTAGKRYRITGWARGDGTNAPNANFGGNVWTGTSSTAWQYFDEETTVTGATTDLQLKSLNTQDKFAEFDDVSVTLANPLNGDITGATINVSAGSKLKKAYTFDGSGDYSDIHSAEINSILDPTKGTLLVFGKMGVAGVWTDGATRDIVTLKSDGNNLIIFRKAVTNNQLQYRYKAEGTEEIILQTTSPTNFFQMAITWDTVANEFKAYNNGVQTGSTLTIAGTWVGNLGTGDTVIGDNSTGGGAPWSGDGCHALLLTEVLSEAVIAKSSKLGGTS